MIFGERSRCTSRASPFYSASTIGRIATS
jgi:hypothetical protein